MGALLTGGDMRFAVRYDPGLMERIAVKRGIPTEPCLFAHPVTAIGSYAYIRGVRTGHMERCRQADTSQDVDTSGRGSQESDRARHIRLRRVELGYAESVRICPPGWQGKATECEVLVWAIPE